MLVEQMNWHKAGTMKPIQGGYRCDGGPEQENGNEVG